MLEVRFPGESWEVSSRVGKSEVFFFVTTKHLQSTMDGQVLFLGLYFGGNSDAKGASEEE